MFVAMHVKLADGVEATQGSIVGVWYKRKYSTKRTDPSERFPRNGSSNEQARVERNVGRDDTARIERRREPEAGWHRRRSWFQQISM
jgi:hypothetical protein